MTPSDEQVFEVAIVETAGRSVVVVLRRVSHSPRSAPARKSTIGNEEEEASLGLLHLALLVSDAFDFAS